MLGLWLCAFGVSQYPEPRGTAWLVGGPDLTVWVAVLLIQSMPYAPRPCSSRLISALDLPGLWIGEAGAPGPATPADTRERRRVRRPAAPTSASPASSPTAISDSSGVPAEPMKKRSSTDRP